jgi:hypothetical protein
MILAELFCGFVGRWDTPKKELCPSPDTTLNPIMKNYYWKLIHYKD